MTVIEYNLRHNRSRLSLLGRAVCILVVGLLFVMPIVKFESLHSNFYDLGQYATFHYAIAFQGSWENLFSTHAHPIALPYVLIYKLFPSNMTLVVLQSTVVVLSAGLYVAYWRRQGLPLPVAGALLYLLSFSTWFAALFEFHFEHLIFPIVFAFFLVIERSDDVWTQVLSLLLGLLLCLVKEVYPLSAAMLGLYLIIRKGWFTTGAILLVLSLIYFAFVANVAIPRYSHGAEAGELWNSAFGYLGNSMPEMLGKIISNPFVLLVEILTTPRKLLFVLVLLGSMAFLPLFRPLTLMPALPIIGISLLSHNANHYYLGHQYTVGIVAILLIAAAQALKAWDSRARIRWIAAMLLATIVTQIGFGPSPISRLFWSPNIFSYHWSAYFLNDHDRKLKQAIEEFIPNDDGVVVSMQNAINADRLSNRSQSFSFPDGVIEELEQPPSEDLRSTPAADFVVLDRRRPLSFRDNICVYNRKTVCEDSTFVSRFDQAVRRLQQTFFILYDEDGIMIAKRHD